MVVPQYFDVFSRDNYRMAFTSIRNPSADFFMASLYTWLVCGVGYNYLARTGQDRRDINIRVWVWFKFKFWSGAILIWPVCFWRLNLQANLVCQLKLSQTPSSTSISNVDRNPSNRRHRSCRKSNRTCHKDRTWKFEVWQEARRDLGVR